MYPVVLSNQPGSAYMATMCGAEHYVTHKDLPEQDLLNLDGVGDVKVVLLLRCCTMRHARGSVTPCPTHLFQLVQPMLSEWMLRHPFVLPSLRDCEAAAAADAAV